MGKKQVQIGMGEEGLGVGVQNFARRRRRGTARSDEGAGGPCEATSVAPREATSVPRPYHGFPASKTFHVPRFELKQESPDVQELVL